MIPAGYYLNEKIIFCLILLSPFLGIFLLWKMYRRVNKKWICKVQKKVLLDNPGMASRDSHSANHSVKPDSILTFLPRQETGIFVINKDTITFHGYKPGNTYVDLRLPFKDAEVTWIGKMKKFGQDYWFRVKTPDETHYFTAETGRLFSSNEKEAKELFRRVKIRESEQTGLN